MWLVELVNNQPLPVHYQITVSGTTGTITGLTPFTEYSCRISAFTVLPGPMTDPAVNVTTSQSGIIIHTVVIIQL